LFVVI